MCEKNVSTTVHGKSMKKISILGDSISTLEGYNPRNYKVFYAGDTCKRSGV